ncbi:hypothetical protein ACAG96_01020 [Candidatus Izemoplasma sp. B36]|uniref:HAAS signaling domain-containing protein n=1 Tax=Candidatus Izemoplasma sp. B36 TaxID=3242468 RepID=UPI003556DB93
MKNLIERYIYDVIRRLPEDKREDIKEELTSNIYEMLSDNPSEEEVKKVLESLGHPRILANKYREQKRYLIGPVWFDDYLLVLKIAFAVVAIITGISSGIGRAINPESVTIIGILFEVVFYTFFDILNALLAVFAIVTIIFMVIERFSKGGHHIAFDVYKLPKLPKAKQMEIKRTSAIASVIITFIVGVVIIYFLYTGKSIAGYFDGDGQFNQMTNFLNHDVVMSIFALIVISIIANIALEVVKLLSGRWTVNVLLVHIFVKLLGAVAAIIFLTRPGMINPDFITEMASYIEGMSFSTIENGFKILFIMLCFLIGLATVVDIGSTTYKYFKNEKK